MSLMKNYNHQIMKQQQKSYRPDDSYIYTFKAPFPQTFSLPYPIIHYILKNPRSPAVWKKLIKTCKFFFSKSPILPIKTLEFNADRLDWLASNDRWYKDKAFFDVNASPMLWIEKELMIDAKAGIKGAAALMPKIWKCDDLEKLELYSQLISYDDFMCLISSSVEKIKTFVLDKSYVKAADGTVLPAEKLVEHVRNVEILKLSLCTFTTQYYPNSFNEIVAYLPKLPKLRRLKLFWINESFDFGSFFDFLMKNDKISIRLRFSPLISDGYKEMLEAYIYQILTNPPKYIPLIIFEGQNPQHFKALESMFNNCG